MNRHSSKKIFAAKKRLKTWHWGLLIGSLVIVISTLSSIAYIHFKQPHREQQVAVYFNHVKSWVSEHKTHLNQGLVKVKRLATNKSETPEIHFEFYTALPSMQLKLADLNTTEENASANNKVGVPVTHRNKVELTEATASKLKQLPNSANLSNALLNANDLEKELSAQIVQKAYVIQLGIFNSKSAAKHYRTTLAAAGLEASIVSTSAAGNIIYRVQLGPFKNMDQARNAQKDLQKKGLNGIMRKIEFT